MTSSPFGNVVAKPTFILPLGEFFVQLFLKIFYSTASSGGFFMLKRYNQSRKMLCKHFTAF